MVQLHGTANGLAEHTEACAGRAQARFGCGHASHRHSLSVCLWRLVLSQQLGVMVTVTAHLLLGSFPASLHPARNVAAAKVVPKVHSGGFYYLDLFFFSFLGFICQRE